jgi:hypothetical protein
MKIREDVMLAKLLRVRLVTPCAALMVYVFLSLPAYSQVDTGSVRGVVTDPAGAVISGAKVTLTSEDTGLAVETVTSRDGNYSFSPVKVGTYKLQVEFANFKTAVERHISVDVQQVVGANFSLTPGSVVETVEVTAVAPLLQTQDASVGTVATAAQINDLPLNGRNYTFLAQLGPGVTSLSPTRGLDLTGSFVANGLTPVHNNYILDGIDNNNDTVDYLNGAAYVNLPPPDAIQEFKVQTSNFSAEFGRAGGAVVNATIKSGTNQFHGSLWEFLRNDKFDATDEYFANPKLRKGELRRNQFGGAIGGPILKDKTFFFGDYEGTRIRQSILHNPTVPTAAQRSSGFTDYRDVLAAISGTKTDLLNRSFLAATIFDPATTRPVTAGVVDPVTGLTPTASGYVRDPFYTNGSVAGITDFTSSVQAAFLNQLPANRLDPNAIKLLNLYPAPNQPGIFNNVVANRSQPDDNNHFDVRIDQILNQRDQLFGRVSYSNRHANIPGDFGGLGGNAGFGQGDFKDKSINLAVSETHAFSATLVNELRFGYSTLDTSAQTPGTNVSGIPAQFGIQGIPQGNGNGGLPAIDITGLTSLGGNAFASPNTRRSKTVQFTENLTKIHGAHSFKGGFEYQNLSFPWLDPAWSRGEFSFGGYTGIPNGQSPGVAEADLLLTPIPTTVSGGVNNIGGANSVFASNITKPEDYRHYYATYFQDDWKATSKLTVNLGLRWEAYTPIGEGKGRQANLIPGSPSGAGAQFVILASAKNIPLSPSFTTLLAQDGIALKYLNASSISTTPHHDFAPRVGLAYQITPKLVGRAGYGIFYGGFENVGGADPTANYPFTVQLSFFRPNDFSPLLFANRQQATLENGLLAASPDPNSPNFVANGLGLTAFQTPGRDSYTQQWNLSFQYELSQNQSLTLGYVGNGSRHALNSDNRNVVTEILPPGTDPLQHVPFRDFMRGSTYLASNGDAYYHGFEAAYERRFSNGINLLANYTRSECRRDYSNSLGIGEGFDNRGASLLPGFGLKKDYRYCGNDVPNLFHTSGIFQLPVGRGRRFGAGMAKVLDEIVGGWSTQWIFTLQDGFAFTIGCPTTTVAGLGCDANVVKGQNPYKHSGPHGITQFLNPAAFANPPVATQIGQTDYSPLGGPPTQARGPGFSDLDFSVFKQFRTTEKTHVEFRGEFFNLVNHQNFSNSFASLDFTDKANFGRINGTRGTARQVQLGLKFYF